MKPQFSTFTYNFKELLLLHLLLVQQAMGGFNNPNCASLEEIPELSLSRMEVTSNSALQSY